MTVKTKKEARPATDDQVLLAEQIKEARANSAKWKQLADNKREELLASLDGDTDIELRRDGRKIADVAESEPRRSMDWKAFQRDHPDLDYDAYLGEATTTVTVRVS